MPLETSFADCHYKGEQVHSECAEHKYETEAGSGVTCNPSPQDAEAEGS